MAVLDNQNNFFTSSEDNASSMDFFKKPNLQKMSPTKSPFNKKFLEDEDERPIRPSKNI